MMLCPASECQNNATSPAQRSLNYQILYFTYYKSQINIMELKVAIMQYVYFRTIPQGIFFYIRVAGVLTT